jgi:hypothetical protein
MIEESLPVIPADRYNNCHDICVITCYFNPEGYKTKLVNYTIFSQKLALSGIALYTIELAFENQPFVLPNTPCSLQIRGEDVIWQKERLINILFQKIPPRFSKIIWLDCDLLFQNENWLVEASAALDDHKVIQPFQWVVRLPRYEQYYSKYGEKHESFALFGIKTIAELIKAFLTSTVIPALPGVSAGNCWPGTGCTIHVFQGARII